MGRRFVVLIALAAVWSSACSTYDWKRVRASDIFDKHDQFDDEPAQYLVTTSTEAMQITVNKADPQAVHGMLVRRWSVVSGAPLKVGSADPDELARNNAWRRAPVTRGEYVHVQRADIIYSSEGTQSHDRDEALYLLGTIAIALAVFAVAYAAQ